MTVLCLVELDADGPADASLRALTFAARLARSASVGSASVGSRFGGLGSGRLASGGSDPARLVGRR